MTLSRRAFLTTTAATLAGCTSPLLHYRVGGQGFALEHADSPIGDVIDVDLSKGPQAWDGVIAGKLPQARALAEAGWREIREKTRGAAGVLERPLIGLARTAFSVASWPAGDTPGEVRAWADALGMDPTEVEMLQCMYSLSQVGGGLGVGCTSGMRAMDPQRGMVHVRTLDWGEAEIGAAIADASCLFRVLGTPNSPYTIVGMAGYIGALTGLVPGKFSLAINWAPPVKPVPSLSLDEPVLLARRVLSTAPDYAAALEMLSRARLSAGTFFSLCGVDRAAVIEVQQRPWPRRDRIAVREIAKDAARPLVQTNHYVAPELIEGRANARVNRFEDEDAHLPLEKRRLLATSRLRRLDMGRALGAVADDTVVEGLKAIMDRPPVHNYKTRQKMVLCPKTGALRAWAVRAS